MTYNRMNPTLDVLLVSLLAYAKVDFGIDAYPLSRAEAKLITDVLKIHNILVTPDNSLMDKVKVCPVCQYPGGNHFEKCGAAK